MVEFPVEELKPSRSTRPNIGKPTEKLSYHACLPSTSYSTLLDDADADVNLPDLDPDMHADPEHCWDIATMTVKEALASWKGKAVNAAMDEEINSLIANGTWELVYGADYDETYAPVGSYVTLRIFLSIVAVLDLHLIQVDEALYFKVGDDRLTCWVLVYVDDLLAASSSLAMLKELKELLEDAFKLREIKPLEKYLRLEIIRDRPARKLWLHQKVCVDKLRRRFIDKEQTGRVLKTPASVDVYAELTFDNEDAQSREEEYR
ncbi:unnamed protein product [Closterium sp. NIES-53]